MCVCVCLCVVIALFFVKSALDRAHTVLYLTCPGYTLLNIRRWIRSHPPDTTLPHLFVSAADGANKNMCSEEMDCFSSVPTKKPRQLS